ncbi:MAG: 2-oxo-4-hydroxy-4-carboxy-5-ureidoimidazoline decarboxylase [Bacteroidota bacterium]|nr:2-oxo-4-hydroxy-4-carboxy-5-ureidoimidazoline decarboxylase [Bacteroidota bacterium]
MTIDQLNRLNETKAFEAFEQCCGASRWVDRMIVGRPYEDLNEMLEISDRVWEECDVDDYQEAFLQHQRMSELGPKGWSGGDGSGNNADQGSFDQLAEADKKYEEKFGHIFVACATGKNPAEMLKMLGSRMENTPEKEILIAAEEQNKITRMRLKKLLHTASDSITSR